MKFIEKRPLCHRWLALQLHNAFCSASEQLADERLKEICCEIRDVSFLVRRECIEEAKKKKKKKKNCECSHLNNIPIGTFGIRSSEELNSAELFFCQGSR